MAKKRRKSDDGRQLSLFDVMRQMSEERREEAGEGSMSIEGPLRMALRAALKGCPLSVHQVAGEMSHLLGEQITAEMIYSWTAESKGFHQIWGSRLPAFCRVTRSWRPLEIIDETAGRFCMPGPEALRAEIQHFSEQERKARAEKRKRETFLKEMEG